VPLKSRTLAPAFTSTFYVAGFSKTAPRKPRPSGDIKETWSMAAWMLDVSSPPVGVTVRPLRYWGLFFTHPVGAKYYANGR
jgi:hypothetical protein